MISYHTCNVRPHLEVMGSGKIENPVHIQSYASDNIYICVLGWKMNVVLYASKFSGRYRCATLKW